MAGFIKNILKMSLIALVVPSVAFGAQQPNPRGTVNSQNEERSADDVAGASVRRSATSVIARSMTQNKRQSRAVVTARPASVRSASVRSARPVVNGAGAARSATKSSLARSGAKSKLNGANASRAGVARATSVFNDVSKIGGGYADCRDSYSTCMDQVCANANDTYRRCFCSDRFMAFQDASNRIDEAIRLLAEFQNTNLDAVNKTAAEVNAMYSATEGEEAIKRDTSASQKLLDNINDILAGKKSTYTSKNGSLSSTSLGVLDFSSLSSGVGDVFSDSASSVFEARPSSLSTSSYNDISSLEGTDLYNAAMQQCTQISRGSCGGDAMFNLARSAYSILVTQDCNAYEKTINAKKASLEDTVRTAEKYLREARLNEYRAHNSADINECLTKVDAAMRQPLACGPNLEECLDFTGLYIRSTGEPVYSQALFGLNNVIVLDGSSDVLSANSDYVQEFERRKKQFAESALDTCRGIADVVWEEYKRMIVIQVAQAQDDKIEEVKKNCVNVVKNCYDTQTGGLNEMAGVTQASSGAISAITARDMCKEDVFACAALYGDIDGCSYDDRTKKLSAVDGKKCGLQSLLAMVDAVDSVKFAKGCEESLREYVKETCAPVSGDSKHAYPWGCRNRSPQWLENELNKQAANFCASDFQSDYSISATNRLNTDYSETVNKIVGEVREEMATILADECWNIDSEGSLVWDKTGYSIEDAAGDNVVNVSPAWLERVYGGRGLGSLQEAGVSGYTLKLERYGSSLTVPGEKAFGWGVCMIPSVEQLCNMQNYLSGLDGTAKYNAPNCELSDEWFSIKCETIGGYFENDQCYIK